MAPINHRYSKLTKTFDKLFGTNTYQYFHDTALRYKPRGHVTNLNKTNKK